MAAKLPLPKGIFAHGWWTVRGEKISKSMPATRIDPLEARRRARRRSARPPDRHRCDALLPAARGAARQRRRLHVRVAVRPVQRRARERPRQPRQPQPDADRRSSPPSIRRRATTRVDAPRPARAARSAGAPRPRARAAAQLEAMAPSARARGDLAARRRGEPLHRPDAAVGAGEGSDRTSRSATRCSTPAGEPVGDRAAHRAGAADDRPRRCASWIGDTRRRSRGPSRSTADMLARRRRCRRRRRTPLFPRLDDAAQAKILAQIVGDAAAPRRRCRPRREAAAPAAKPAAPPRSPPRRRRQHRTAAITLRRLRQARAAGRHGARRPPPSRRRRSCSTSRSISARRKPRSIVAGIAEAYAPEQLVGKQVIVVANLAPRQARGPRLGGHDPRRRRRGDPRTFRARSRRARRERGYDSRGMSEHRRAAAPRGQRTCRRRVDRPGADARCTRTSRRCSAASTPTTATIGKRFPAVVRDLSTNGAFISGAPLPLLVARRDQVRDPRHRPDRRDRLGAVAAHRRLRAPGRRRHHHACPRASACCSSRSRSRRAPRSPRSSRGST